MSDVWLLMEGHFLMKPRQLNKHVVVGDSNVYEQTTACILRHLSTDSKIEMTQNW